MRRPGSTVRLFVLFLLMLPLCCGCCLTNHMWNGVRALPVGIREAQVEEPGVLHVDLQYTNGETLRVDINLHTPSDRFPNFITSWPEPESVDVAAREVLRGVVRIADGPLRVGIATRATRSRSLGSRIGIYSEPGRYVTTVPVPNPLTWAGGRVVAYALLTPLTAAVDIVTAPVNVAWVLFTAGGHGANWVSWCDAKHSPRVIDGEE